MSRLLIEKLMQEAEVEKTAAEETNPELEKQAEEAQMEKLAQEVNTLDQSRTLIAVGEAMYKIAEELENENLTALAVDTYQLGERMGSCLTKTASESGTAIIEALEIAEDMHKIATVYAEIADEIKDEEFNKLASEVVDIANEMTDEANEVYAELEAAEKEETEKLEKEAAEKKTSEELEKEAGIKDSAKNILNKLKYEGGFKAMQAKELIEKNPKKSAGIAAGAVAALSAAGYAKHKSNKK